MLASRPKRGYLTKLALRSLTEQRLIVHEKLSMRFVSKDTAGIDTSNVTGRNVSPLPGTQIGVKVTKQRARRPQLSRVDVSWKHLWPC